jgi:hypothetical protein
MPTIKMLTNNVLPIKMSTIKMPTIKMSTDNMLPIRMLTIKMLTFKMQSQCQKIADCGDSI